MAYVYPVRTIDLDHNATTPLDPAVRDVMVDALDHVSGNPSSVHRAGRQARARLDDARDRLASVCQCKPAEIVFTSGGTESNNLAILGTARHHRGRGRHIITSAVEHHAVLNPCRHLADHEGFEVTELPVDGDGRINVDDLERAIRSETILVSIQAANNEIGTLQPTAAIADLCRERNLVFHTDAVQWFGKEPLAALQASNADLVSLSAHKFHGPKGVGALLVRAPFSLDAIIHGGGQENERRGGTENLTGIVGLAEAASRFLPSPVFDRQHLAPLTDRIRSGIGRLPGLRIFTPERDALSNTLAFSVAGADSLSLLAGLDLEGIRASSGSACSVGSLEPSHVLQAIGASREEASSMIRFSLGRETVRSDIDVTIGVLERVCEQARQRQ